MTATWLQSSVLSATAPLEIRSTSGSHPHKRLNVNAFVFLPGCVVFQRGLREWLPHRAYMTLI